MNGIRPTRRSWRRRGTLAVVAAALAWSSVIGAPVARLVPAATVEAAGTFSDPFFREFTVWSGLTKPISVRFASDGRAFVAEKGGVVKAYDSITDTTPTTVIDIRDEVNSYWDRGLLGIAVDPDFLLGRPFLYLYYVYDAPPGATAPVWDDACLGAPNGPGGTTDGCTVTAKLVRIELDPATNALEAGSATELIHDWCQQFPSHAGGGMAFGPDKQLYLAGGDGASFNTQDYGQKGGTIPDPANPFTDVNPCGDPVTITSPPGSTPTVNRSSAQGGSLRSQDIRTTTDPVGLDGTLIRIDPTSATGAASAGNPLAANADANARRIVAHGFRNAFRLAFRPGTSDLYLGDVGNQTWEEIERVAIPTSPRTPTTLPNFGWPCYEGPGPAATWQPLGVAMCDALYATGGSAVTGPLYAYSHVDTKTPTGPCFEPDATGKAGSSITGLAFYGGSTNATTTPYPAAWNGALFFVDYTRNCLAALPAGPGGVPNAAAATEVASGLADPVDLVTGPGGDLYYVDLDGGRVVRIRYVVAPNAKATATPAEAHAPVTVHLDGSASTDPDPAFALAAWRWDLDGDGHYDDATGATYDWAITTPGVYQVGLEVESTNGLTDTVSLVVDATNDLPEPVIDTPSDSLTWSVDDTISFTGHATDTEDGTIPAADLDWDVVMLHCPAGCHEHVVQSFTGKAGGSFSAPDHEYPSHLELRLSATDSHGSTRRTSIELMPKTATIDVDSTPGGVPISVNADPVVSPSSTTVIRGGSVTVSPPVTRTIGGVRHRFSTWGDSQARVRELVATGPLSLLATYVPDAPDSCATATTSSATTTWLSDRASGNGDADWFRFALTSKRRVIVTLGNLPVDARLDLYSGCSTLLASANSSGTRFEELTRVLSAGTYRVRVSFATGAWSAAPYSLRFRPMATGLVIPTKRTTSGATGGAVRIVGEVLNNTGTTRGPITVKATFRSAGGSTVATISTTAFAKRLADGGLTPFVLSGTVPAYASVSYTLTSGSLPAARSLTLSAVTTTANANGTVTEKGTVKNTGSTTATSVRVARTWYGKLGEVLDSGQAVVSPSTLGAGKSGSYTIIRPALPTWQASRTQARAL